VVLEGIAFAETALLNKYPELGESRIIVHFKSLDEKYDRVEYWHRLKYWAPEKTCPLTHVKESLSVKESVKESLSAKKKSHHRKKHYRKKQGPHVCMNCVK